MDEQQPISWQYIVLVAAIAVMTLLVAAAPIPIERVERPLSLNDAELTQHYSDEGTGISIDYPDGWQVIPVEPGYFMLSNYDADPAEPPQHQSQVVIHFLSAPYSAFRIPEDITVTEILEAMLNRSGRGADEMTEVSIGDFPGARAHFLERGIEKERFLITPADATLVFIEADTVQGAWDEMRDLFDRMMDTLEIQPVAG